MGITVLVPDINRSAVRLRARRGSTTAAEVILFGLSAVRNVGEGLVELIIAEREANGPFADFYDFCERVDLACSTSGRSSRSSRPARSTRSATRARGCSRSSSRSSTRRSPAAASATWASCRCSARSTARRGGVRRAGRRSPTLEFDKTERLAFEKEMLGLYVSDHPLIGVEGSAAPATATPPSTDIAEIEDGRMQTVGGVVTGLQRKCTKGATSWPCSSSRTSRPRSRSWSSPRR